MLSISASANADSPSSAIQILDVNLVPRDAVSARNGCWDDAPMDATVACGPPTPEHEDLIATIGFSSARTSDIVIGYESMDITATAGTDYVALDGTLTIKAGESEGSIHIEFIDDLLEEGNEEFVVAITGENINLRHTHIHVTILDEESIKVLIANASQTEGHPDGMLVDLSFTESVAWPFTIRARTTAGTAGTSDYQDWPEVSIPGTPEQPVTSFTFTHPLIDDSLHEPNETYTITAWGYDNLGREPNSATMTIIDDDDAPEASIADVSGLEDSVGNLSFDVTLNTASTKEITLGYATADDTATAGSDYTQTNGTLTFSAGETTKTIDVPVLEDGSPEEDETFTVTLSNVVNATIGDSTGTGTIQDDDPVPTALSIGDVEGLESSDALEFPVTLTGDREAMTTVTVDYATSDGTGTAGSDYTEMSGTLTFATDMTRQTIRVPLLDDPVDEPDETFVVTLSNSSGAMLDDSEATGTIRDNDATSAGIALTATPARVLEDAGATVVAVTATLDAGARTGATEVTVSVSGSGNADAVDFAGVQDFTITIAAGDRSGTGNFTLTPEDDNVDESDETLSVTGTSDLPVTGVEVELADDDATSSSVSLTAEPPRVSEGAGATPVEVTATLDAGARSEATTVTVTVSGSGNADAVDFADVADFTITIPAGDTSGSGTFTLTPEDDNVDESDETLNVDGSSVLPVTADTVALADDDQPSAAILLSASPGRIAEDGGASPVQVTATLDSSARAVATTVSVSVSGSGRPDAVGYAASATAFDITITAGETAGTGTFTVTPEDDEVDERDEVLDIAGTSNLPVKPTSVTLADDEQTSTEILLSAVPSTVSEGAGATPVEVTATLDAGARSVSTTVTVTVSGSGNADAVDFADVADFTIMIPAGDTSGSGTFTLTPEDDNVDESDETLNVDGSSVLPVTADTVALADDDQPSAGILLSASPGRIAEDGGASPVQVTATLDSSARPVATTVSVSVSGSGRPDAVDYAASATAFDITIAAGATAGTGTFTVTPANDEVDERDEVLDIAGTSDLPVTPASVTLADDDQTSTEIVLSAVPSTVSEGAGATPVEVTATLDAGARTVSTTVTVEVTGSGDPDAVDFASVRDLKIMIAAGATSGRWTFTLTPDDDDVAESSETLTVDGSSDLPVTKTSVTLTDDDVASSGIVLSASPSLVSEDGGAVGVKVTASLNGAARQVATTVTVSVAGSGNPRAVDFQAAEDFEITIAPNAASGTGTFTLTPVDDGTAEVDETLTMSGASDLPVTPATVTLADDDDPSTRILLSAVPGRVSEGDGPTPVTVTATLDRALRQQATTVTVAVSGSGDAGAADFAAVADFSITIPANAASGAGTFTLTPRDDATAEANEQLTVSGASDLPVTPATVTLADDDDPSTRILLSAVPGRVSEGDGATPVTVTATLDRALRQQETAVTVTVSGSGDAGAADFAAVADFSITIPANAASGAGTFTLTPRDDATVEADETLTVSGASDLPVTPATVTLADDDDPSTRILLLAVPERVSEGDGATRVTVTATLDRALRQQATAVTVSVSGSGDASASDFEAVPDFSITIPANAASGAGTFTLTPEDDAMVESNETLTVSGASDLPVTPAVVTLADDDEVSTRILLFLTVDPPRASEGDGEILVTVTAEVDRGVRPDESRIRVAVSGSGDPNAVDFAAVTDFEIVIPANAPNGSGTFTVVPEDDLIVEADELLTISGVSDLPVSPATLELLDDDEASTRILLSADPAQGSEGDGPVTVTVTASLDRGLRQEATTVTVSVTGGGDPNAVDFAAVTDFEIVIPANAPNGSGTFTVVPEDDLIVEADEVLTVSGVSDLPVRPATMELLDDDEASGRILLAADPARVSEGDGPVAVTVTATLDRGLRQSATTVTVSVTGGGDPHAVDFAAVADFDIVIPANAPNGSGTFTVVPEDDLIVEADELLTVSGVSDLPVSPATMELLDDDEASGRIVLSADPALVSEGDGPVAVTVTASLDRGLRLEATTVTVSVTGGGDPDAVDFAAVAGFDIVIPANAPDGTGTFTVVPEDDLIVEADETLTVSGASDLPVTPATMELLDDDEASGRIVLSADPALVSEGDGPVAVTVTASLDRGLRLEATTVTVSVTGSGDADAVDFAPIPDLEIVIPANASNGTATFTVVPEDDLIVEADETLTVSGVSDLPVSPATMELLDDDEASGRILLSADPARVSEGDGPVAVTVSASLDRGLRQQATTVTVSVAGSGNPDAVNFAAVADFDITIEANAPSGTNTFTLMPEDDAEDEADETLALTGESDLPVTPASVVLVDDDEMASRVLSIADAEAAEGAGGVSFAVTLDGPSAAEVTVGYATANPAGFPDPVAEPGIDYESASGTLTFAPGELSRTIRVSVLDDELDEPDETFALVLSDLRGAALGRGSALGTIRDDDEPPALSIAGDTGREDVGELVFSVTLMARALTEVTVNYATMDDTAIAGDDYEPVEGTLTFAPGETARTIRVAVVDDAVDEADEEVFAVTLSGPSGATLAHALATGVIRDNDEPPALSVADAAGDEDVGALEFAVALSAPSGIEVSVSYATADDTATAGSDYAAAMGTLAFAPGEVSQTIRVAILDDALHEADEETFEMTLARLANATAADVSATGTIRDNDLAPPAVAGDLPAALLCVGGAPYELDLADYFDGKELRFSAISSTPRVATAALAGSRLTVAPASEGESSVTVTASNDAGSASGSIGVRVVTDPAELEAVESVLASIGRAVLTGVTESVRARFGPRSASGEQSASTNVQRGRTQVVPGASAVIGNQWPGPPMRGTRSGGWDKSNLFEPQVSGEDWFETMNRTYRRGMAPFSFSLDSAQSGSTGPAWTVWGRADAHRFESGIDGSSHDGTLTAVHLGADARVGDWLAGVSVARSAADADYRFERSVDACGGGGIGEGMVDAELTSVHPYVGRQIGRGSMWATLGAGAGEVSVERCENGQRNEADLSMRLGALGGRHPFAGGERIEISVVEEIGVLDLTTGDALGPVGDRSVTVGQARLGLEASGVVPAGCDCSLSSFVRAFARGDWGDGATGTGLELAAGVRFRNVPRRLGIDAGIRALAAHSAEDASERSANLTFSLLPKADGIGWQASLAWRQGAGDSRLDALAGISPWTAPSASLPGAERRWIAESRLGYGIRLQRGFATPFVELDAGHSRRGARFGVRHEFGDRARGLVVEWGIEQHRFFAGVENRIVLEALGRF